MIIILYVDIVDAEQRSLDLRVISTHRQELLEVDNTIPIEIKFLKWNGHDKSPNDTCLFEE